MKNFYKALIFFVVLLFAGHAAIGNTFIEERQYEPVVTRGGILAPFYDIPVEELYMFAYDETEQALKVIPFQIDERIRTLYEFVLVHPDMSEVPVEFERHYYANSGIGLTDDGVLDNDDELVFLVGDLGSEAPAEAWEGIAIENDLKKTIAVSDPNDPSKHAVGYLVHSKAELTIPNPYNFSYDVENDVVSNAQYSIRMARPSGLIEDISIAPPYGNGIDIFDTQKIRLIGNLDIGGFVQLTPGLNGLPALNDRDNFYVFPPEVYISVTENPVVRLVREVHQTIKAGEGFYFSLYDVSFFVTTKFYPYSGSLEGGASLNPDVLEDLFEDADYVYIQFDLVRQSWDYNENAAGMKFYNPQNDGLLIDGVPDLDVDDTLTSEELIREWTMISGNQGTMFAHLTINDTTYQTIELYYHDNEEGGQDDDSFVEGGDTGDGKSYGDQGLKIINSKSLDLGFTAYFVEKNKDQVFGEQLAYNVENPVKVNSFTVGVAQEQIGQQPNHFELLQNYPNPFNNSTKIAFRLPSAQHVELSIVDVNGRTIKTLVDQVVSGGLHEVQWNGLDETNQLVSSGLYFYQMSTENHTRTRKLLLVK